MTKRLFLFSLIIVSIFVTCHKKIDLTKYNIIENDKLISETRYALIRPEFLRLRQEPDYRSQGIATLYRYDMVEVVLLVNQTGGWCKLSHGKMDGWLPVGDLIIFDSYESALSYQNSYKRHLGNH